MPVLRNADQLRCSEGFDGVELAPLLPSEAFPCGRGARELRYGDTCFEPNAKTSRALILMSGMTFLHADEAIQWRFRNDLTHSSRGGSHSSQDCQAGKSSIGLDIQRGFNQSSASDGLSTGAKAGVGVGVAKRLEAGAVLIFAVHFWLWRRRSSQQRIPLSQNNEPYIRPQELDASPGEKSELASKDQNWPAEAPTYREPAELLDNGYGRRSVEYHDWKASALTTQEHIAILQQHKLRKTECHQAHVLTSFWPFT
ncbi:uncharacterized protein MYCFIDRAFT_175248 [Pseudocercospora fijiensis CIRAD86]|uniref:Uncharacterized protein n=1 Tax=Pseudocercospora fijiensis (strain CIRAD86) TaxID=383855 RepID=M2YVC0_PSEFD|nr:uncharacterized protein MYCFIDRAFT_175248 [Pseudocercospora fijiensis CIRAD86]EME81665.1 hypothetical protein MYCFIDRAFT_175248 [Pseudocercospora fijiensis CIRAD86]